MILDVFENRDRYYSLHKGFNEAFDFLEKCLESPPATGKYEVQGNQIYALVQQYETAPAEERKWEGHRKYIDIQFMLSGREIIEWANIADAADIVYNEEKDVLRCFVPEGTDCKLSKGCFAVFYPEDLHKPSCIWDEKNIVGKIVVKVAV